MKKAGQWNRLFFFFKGMGKYESLLYFNICAGTIRHV